LSGTEYMLLTGRVNFGLIQLCLRMVPSYLRDTVHAEDMIIYNLYVCVSVENGEKEGERKGRDGKEHDIQRQG
jgi:hypothetical protein